MNHKPLLVERYKYIPEGGRLDVESLPDRLRVGYRTESVKNYLMEKGISGSRVTAVGYGESKLLNNCKSDAPCSEDEHAKNRRTEFKVVEVGKL